MAACNYTPPHIPLSDEFLEKYRLQQERNKIQKCECRNDTLHFWSTGHIVWSIYNKDEGRCIECGKYHKRKLAVPPKETK